MARRSTLETARSLENGAPYMVMEYLAGMDLAIRILQSGLLHIEQADDAAAKVQAEQWKAMLKEYKNGADRVLKSMRYYRDRESRPARRDVIEKSIDYLANQARAGRMNYKEALDANHPIGTGVTEAAAKTLVSVRMKRAGARYNQHGGQTVLTFRAHMLSARFEVLWEKIDETYRGAFREAA